VSAYRSLKAACFAKNRIHISTLNEIASKKARCTERFSSFQRPGEITQRSRVFVAYGTHGRCACGDNAVGKVVVSNVLQV
jgi:hypothetical protein